MTAPLECALSDHRLKPLDEPPLLSIVVLTHNRLEELILTVSCLADQLTDGLEGKVEIVISDNASDADTQQAIRGLAERYDQVSYLFNARDEGGFFNLFAAPWRARGRYTWVFGSDDILLDGGIAHVVELLEREAPSFLTMNKKLANADLSQMLWSEANTIPDRRFDSFIDLFCAVGVNQVAFLSAQLESTEAARTLETERFLRTESRHPHIGAFLKKHAHKPCFYSSATHIVHRIDNSPILDYHAGNFYDYAVTLPRLLQEIGEEVGAPVDFFERISGYKRIADYEPPQVTFVDNIFENILRALHFGRHLTVGHQRSLEAALAHCRPDRVAQFGEIWKFNLNVVDHERKKKEAEGALTRMRNAALATSEIFTRPTSA